MSRDGARDRIWREAGMICLIGIAVTHVLAIQDEGAQYMRVMFGCLAAASAILALLLLVRRGEGFAWPAAGVLALLAIAGYVLSRAVGLPQMADDMGQWTVPTGIAALAFESVTVALAARFLFARRAAQAPAPGLAPLTGQH